MKRLLLLLTVICGVFALSNVFANDSKQTEDELLRKSLLTDPGIWANNTSYPYPFIKTGDPVVNPITSPPVSTGYYFVHSNDPADAPWRPEVIIADTTNDALNWRRILSGPRQREASYWDENPEEGLRYFRNPVSPNTLDSTQNALAGPIPIGFEFVFNGIVYDSFYVFTNGGIMLSNNRYFYNSAGEKEVRPNNYGTPNCYNTMSADWFDRGGRSGDGISDNTPDNWGWLRANAIYNQGAARISNFSPQVPIIAPFWGTGVLSQWDDVDKEPRDRGRVYYYKDPTGYKLMIYFVDYQLVGPITYPYGTVNPNVNAITPGDNQYIGASAVITLDRRDSSVNITYERFRGRIDYSIYLFPAKLVMRMNTDCGVFGYARHLNYNSKIKTPGYTGTLPWAAEYDQITYCWSHYYAGSAEYIGYPEDTQAIKFKPWKNTLRVCDIGFRVRKQQEGATDYTEKVLTTSAANYEILAGHEQIGTIQPVSIVENLSNDIQGPSGVNFQPQDLNFRVRCAVINQATRRPLYNKYVKVDSISLALKKGEAAYEKIILSKVKFTGTDYDADTMHTDYYDGNNNLKPQWNGIPPYGFVQVFFPPFEPNELFLSHIGLMKCFVMVDPTDPRTGEGFRDMWPFDDTLNIRFWVMRHIPNDEPFTDDVTEYHVVPNEENAPTAIPSVFKWVSIGATVVNGENVSRNPLPPRGEYFCENDEVYPTYKVSSPTIKLVRPPTVAIGQWGGYEIRSFPIDMFEKDLSVLTLAIQRSTNKDDWARGWSDQTLVGCEHRVVSSNWYTEQQIPDVINVEFGRPSPNWRDGTRISNLAAADWRFHPRRNGAQEEKKMPAYQLFGGGGYMVGFLETDKDSALAPPVFAAAGRAENGLRYNYYDDGIDFEYQKLYIPIPDTFIHAANEGAKYFRFRVQVYAKNNQLAITTIPDDDDPYYVDNVRILYATDEDVDIEMTKVVADWPFTVAPASQAIAVPIKMQLSNNTSKQSGAFWLKSVIVRQADFDQAYFLDDAWIWRGDPDDEDMKDFFEGKNQQARDSARWILMHTKPIYCTFKQLPYLRPGSNETVAMPNWNARLSPPGNYVIIGVVKVPGGDLEPKNDTTFSTTTITFGPIFAYHPVVSPSDLRRATNDVEQMAQEFGRGLTTRGYKMGGVSSYNPIYAIGDAGGDGGAGQIAAKFTLFQEDTIFGYGAYFATKNLSPDYISYRMYDGENTPGNQIPNSLIESKRGYDQLTDSHIYGQFVFVTLPKFIVLPKGTYWVSIGQLGETGIELGASKSKVGMRCTNVYFANPQTDVDNGKAGIYLNIEKTFREKEKFGNIINKNFFAFENGLGSGTWQQFMATIGNPSYAHLIHTGTSPVDGQTPTYSRGAWMPLLVPYLGNRTFAANPTYLECDIPVELSYFKGAVRLGAIDLLWETASEQNNAGFYVERRIVNGQTNDWKTLPEFVSGHNTSNISHEYNFVDKDVIPNTTYQYRLRQVDLDGTQTCDDFTNIVTLTYTDRGSVVLLPNQPNPFIDGTTLNFTLPSSSMVTLDILDVYGNVITTLVNEELSAGPHNTLWDATGVNNVKVASGTYIYRLKVGDQVLTGKMSLVK